MQMKNNKVKSDEMEAANALVQMIQSTDVLKDAEKFQQRNDSTTSILKDAKNLVVPRKRKKNPNNRRRNVCYESSIARASLFISETLPVDLDVDSIILLIRECLIYESLFFWQADVTERYRTECPHGTIELFGHMLRAMRSSHRKIVGELLELPNLRRLRNHDKVLKRGDVANLALTKANVFVIFGLQTIRQFESIAEVTAYFEKRVKTSYIPKSEIAQPIISTFGKCFKIASVEDTNSS